MKDNKLYEYVKEFQAGNREIFEKIYNATNNQLFNVIRSFTKDEELSYDLMQETYITFYTKAESINNPASTQKWLIIVAINKAKRYLQTKNKDIIVAEEHEDIFENQEECDEELLPQEVFDNKEKQKIIKDIIDNLPLEQKTAVYLYYFNEMSLSEVAEEMGCSKGTVKSRLNYARKKIKVEVDSWGKKGTKLYSTGVPILVLLLKSQIQKANAMNLDTTKDILNNITNSNISTSHMSNKKNMHKGLSNKIIGSIVAGGLAISIISGYQIIKHKNNHINQSNEVTVIESNNAQDGSNVVQDIEAGLSKKKDNINSSYVAYDEFGINSVGDIKSSNNHVIVNDLLDDRCIEIVNKENLTNKEDTLYVDGKQIDITLEDDGTISTSYEPNSDITYIPFKEFTDGDIVTIDGYDSNIIDIKVNNAMKNISFTKLSLGETSVNVKDNNGKNGELKITITQDENGILFPEYTIHACKEKIN